MKLIWTAIDLLLITILVVLMVKLWQAMLVLVILPLLPSQSKIEVVILAKQLFIYAGITSISIGLIISVPLLNLWVKT